MGRLQAACERARLLSDGLVSEHVSELGGELTHAKFEELNEQISALMVGLKEFDAGRKGKEPAWEMIVRQFELLSVLLGELRFQMEQGRARK